MTSAVYGDSAIYARERHVTKSSITSTTIVEAQDNVPALPKWNSRKKSRKRAKDKGGVVLDNASIFSDTIFVGDMEEGRNFGVQDIMNTLGINSVSCRSRRTLLSRVWQQRVMNLSSECYAWACFIEATFSVP